MSIYDNVVEAGMTEQMFGAPADPRMADYLNDASARAGWRRRYSKRAASTSAR
jgi:hypothetical protein